MQAAYYAQVPVRVFTREHPSIRYYTRHPLSRHRLIWDCSTNAIAGNKKSRELMIEDGIPDEKITLIPTGFDIREYENVEAQRIEKLREKYLSNPFCFLSKLSSTDLVNQYFGSEFFTVL